VTDPVGEFANRNQSLQLSNGEYSLPVSWFDPDAITHAPASLSAPSLANGEIALPAAKTPIATSNSTLTKLAQWLQNSVVEGQNRVIIRS